MTLLGYVTIAANQSTVFLAVSEMCDSEQGSLGPWTWLEVKAGVQSPILTGEKEKGRDRKRKTVTERKTETEFWFFISSLEAGGCI